MADPDLRAPLATVLRRALDADDVAITGLERLSGGASRVTYAVDASVDGEARPLILQRTRPGSVGTGIHPRVEASLVRAALGAGVRVAPVVAAGGDPGLDAETEGVLGDAWVLSDRLEGETRPARLLRDDAWAAARSRLVDDCGAALAAIHRIPVDAAPGLESADRVARFRDVLAGFADPHPVLELGLRWLDEHRPPATGPDRVVHGDFRTGNLLVDHHGLAAVLDWELAHLGDPLEDLGWFCVRAWRFGSPRPAGGIGSREQLAAAYEAAGGAPVDPEALRWWEVMGTLTWGVICLVQAASHLSGLSRSVELATIGRRVTENELDLLRLLPGPDPEPDHEPIEVPALGAAPGTLRGVPTAAELVDAVRGWVESDVADATTGRVHFHGRVASNALKIVERELALGPAHTDLHRGRLARLGAADDQELAAAIRSGALDGRRDELMAALGASVLDRIAVDHPGYEIEPS